MLCFTFQTVSPRCGQFQLRSHDDKDEQTVLCVFVTLHFIQETLIQRDLQVRIIEVFLLNGFATFSSEKFEYLFAEITTTFSSDKQIPAIYLQIYAHG